MTELQYHYQWLTDYQPHRPTVICLHGFMGTGATFMGLFSPEQPFNFLAVDLIGHGQTSVYVHPEYYWMTAVIAALQSLTRRLQIDDYYLLGYSMGGRVALAWAINDSRVRGLILESASPGIADPGLRDERSQHDDDLAKQLLTRPLVDFVDRWERLPLFASQKALPPVTRMRIREERLSQQNYGLAMSLMMMGTGRQPNYWPRLPQHVPTLLIVGRLDRKFQAIARQMKQTAPQITITTLNGGHCVHLEQAAQFAATVCDWLADQPGQQI